MLSYKQFVGDSERVETTYEFQVLSSRTIDPQTRSKFGLTEGVGVAIYLAPFHLIEKFGDWKLDTRKIRIEYLGETYIISNPQYLGHIPVWKGCIAVQLILQDDISGGQ